MLLKLINILCVAVLAMCVYYLTQDKDFGSVMSSESSFEGAPRVEVSAHELKKVAADKFVTSFQLELRGKDKAVLFQKMTERRGALFANVMALDIPEKNVEQNSVEVRKEWNYNDGKRVLEGYTATQSFEVTVDRKADAAALVMALAAEPDVEIRRTSALLKDESAIQAEVIKAAGAKAMAKAKSYAQSVDAKVGKVLYLSGDGDGIVYSNFGGARRKGMMLMNAAMDGAAADESSIADSVEVSASLRLVVELKQ